MVSVSVDVDIGFFGALLGTAGWRGRGGDSSKLEACQIISKIFASEEVVRTMINVPVVSDNFLVDRRCSD